MRNGEPAKSHPKLGSEDVEMNVPPGEMTVFDAFSKQALSADEVEDVLHASATSKPLVGVEVARLPLFMDPSREDEAS